MLDRILNALRRSPKIVDPRTHAVLDFLTTSYFLLLGSYYWDRDKRPAATALVNGFMVLGLTMLTDYDGDGRRPVSFRTHGKMDLVQAATALGMPALLGFANEASAAPFMGQAANEGMVVAITDWDRDQLSSVGRRAA